MALSTLAHAVSPLMRFRRKGEYGLVMPELPLFCAAIKSDPTGPCPHVAFELLPETGDIEAPMWSRGRHVEPPLLDLSIRQHV
jgi:hypothetical protein